jgi:hypothetical protein
LRRPTTPPPARHRAFTVALGLVALVSALAAPALTSAADPAAAEARRMEAYWTGDRIRAAQPRDIVLDVPPGTTGSGTSPANGGTAPAVAGAVDGASWTGGGAVVKRTGLILFSIGSGDFSCSGSVIQDDGDPTYSLIFTAAHCAYDLDTGAFVTNWTYVPAWDETPDAADCSETRYGCWDARALVVHDGWASESGLTIGAVQHDYGIAVVGAVRGGTTQLDSLGAYPLRMVGVAQGDTMRAFGYPAEAPYNGLDLVYCAGATSTQQDAGSWGLVCDMTGGASGGPWLWGTSNPATASGEVASVSSYRLKTDAIHLYGTVLDGATRSVYDMARAATPDASGIDDLIATGVAEPPTPFTDINGSTFRSDIEWLYTTGITFGCGPTTFCPTAHVTREQMAGFLVRGFDLPAASTDYFTDDESSSLEAEINALRQSAITFGCAPSRYCPKADVTREQMAGFLVRALDLPPTSTDYFTDDSSSTFQAQINALRKAGITTGCTATTFCPKSTVTREQMAGFLHRALGD